MINIERLKQAMAKKKTKSSDPLYLSTGSTLLNLSMTGTPNGGWLTGHYFLFVGDSDSGKSWFMHTALAEASINPAFDDYDFIYDNTESKSLMDIERYFGKRLAGRIESARVVDGIPQCSEHLEDFYYNVDDRLKSQKPFIWILDSQDSLTCNRESNKFDKLKKQSRGAKVDVSTGDFSDGKAKVHSSHLRQLITPLAATNSMLVIVNQSRDSFDMFNKDSFGGGRALKFYSVCQLWSSHGGKIQKEYKGKKRQQGIKSKIAVKKNHITGRQSEVVVPIYHSHGIDDVGCCADWLLSEGVWKKNQQGVITATGIGPSIEAKREALVRKIEDKNLEEDVQDLVCDTWSKIEEATAVDRKSRY